MVGRRLAALLLQHPFFELDMAVGSNAKSGELYSSVWREKEEALHHHYGEFWRKYPVPDRLNGLKVSSLDDLLRSDCNVVFSSLPERASDVEETLLNSGRTVFSNSPYRRFDRDVALVVPEVNGERVRCCQLIKNPNCVTSGLVLLLAPLSSRYGLREVVVTTYQSLSGRGDAKYPPDLVLGNIYPLHRSAEGTEGYIRNEVKKILGAAFPISVTCNRTSVQEGHYVEVRVKTQREIDDVAEVCDLLAEFNPLRRLQLHTSPPEPIVILSEAGRPRPAQDSNHHQGMAVAVGNISIEDDVFDLRLTYVVNNLIRGAAGGALLNAELWHSMRLSRDASLPAAASAPMREAAAAG
jgi:aspartate-semialdehyde dehydrogenase